ncbi:MAG: Hsp20/alpha crystallin family protein [Cyanophyceae cyanobacterium]
MTVIINKEPTWCPAIEFSETDTALILKAEVPGVERKDLNVHVTSESVTITGVHPPAESIEQEIVPSEFHYGRLQCQVPVKVPVQPEQARAELINGVLTVNIPKLGKN